MNFVEELFSNSDTSEQLSSYIDEQFDTIYSNYNRKYVLQPEEIRTFSDYLEEKRDILENLEYSTIKEKAFISFLFDICEQYGLIATACIENTLRLRSLYFGKRREAAKLFLLGIKNNSDYLDRFEEFCEQLDYALENEEDDERNVLVTFANFYRKVINDTSNEYIEALKGKIVSAQECGDYKFIRYKFIEDLLLIDTKDIEAAYRNIQTRMTNLFVPKVVSGAASIPLLIEQDSEYAAEIEKCSSISFRRIREIAIEKCTNYGNRVNGRGVQPLYNEDELYKYLVDYGNMHEAKLLSAFEKLDLQRIKDKEIEIIDWGCGQGLASIVLLDYIRSSGIKINISRVLLIEPSELAIKRAALHIRKAINNIKILTICKYFNNLEKDELETSLGALKIHLFSNTLDLDEDLYSQSRLLKILEESQRYDNIFVCVSPHITDEKTNRIDAFKRYFHRKHSTFQLFSEETVSKDVNDIFWSCNHYYKFKYIHNNHNFCNQNRKWTKVVRVFYVSL